MVLAVEPKLSLCLVTMKEEKGKHISERKRREEKRKRKRFPYICLGNGEERRQEEDVIFFWLAKGKEKKRIKNLLKRLYLSIN